MRRTSFQIESFPRVLGSTFDQCTSGRGKSKFATILRVLSPKPPAFDTNDTGMWELSSRSLQHLASPACCARLAVAEPDAKYFGAATEIKSSSSRRRRSGGCGCSNYW